MLSARAWPFTAKYSRHNVTGLHEKLPLSIQLIRLMGLDDPLWTLPSFSIYLCLVPWG